MERAVRARSACNTFITPSSVKQSKMLTLLYFHTISRICKSAIIVFVCGLLLLFLSGLVFCFFFFFSYMEIAVVTTCDVSTMLGACGGQRLSYL